MTELTDKQLLELAFTGGTEEWIRLHELCQDRLTAKRLSRLLTQHGRTNPDAAASWLSALGEHFADLLSGPPP